MASYLDAKAHGGRCLLRIEDIDRGRSRPEATLQIIGDLDALGFRFEPNPWHQSLRLDRYQAAFEKLRGQHLIYPCICSRKDVEDSEVYPGNCRRAEEAGKVFADDAVRAWRLKLDPCWIEWHEGAWLGPLHQATSSTGYSTQASDLHREEVSRSVGDFVIARPRQLTSSKNSGSKGFEIDWTYQLSVVVDDQEAGVTHVVRGMDLLDSTGRQIYLQAQLGYRRLNYWHCPLVVAPNGQKLSKQNGAPAINTEQPLATLNRALLDLGLTGFSSDYLSTRTLAEFWESAISMWREQMLHPDR
jgi:glutamyl-Q tRNA(Asp) synthetase